MEGTLSCVLHGIHVSVRGMSHNKPSVYESFSTWYTDSSYCWIDKMCSTRLIQWSLLVLAYHHMFSSGSMNVEFSRLTEIDPKKDRWNIRSCALWCQWWTWQIHALINVYKLEESGFSNREKFHTDWKTDRHDHDRRER